MSLRAIPVEGDAAQIYRKYDWDLLRRVFEDGMTQQLATQPSMAQSFEVRVQTFFTANQVGVALATPGRPLRLHRRPACLVVPVDS